MSRSALHTPFAQQQTSSSSSSRVSPFQRAASSSDSSAASQAAALESEDHESAWIANHYGVGLRQRYLDVFEPASMTPHSSSMGRSRSYGRSRDQDQQRMGHAAPSGPAHLRIVVADDVLNSSSMQPHIIRARAILTTSNSSRDPLPLTHPVNISRLHTTNSVDSADAHSPRSRYRTSSNSPSASFRRLQRRSSSLLAATSATASNLWSSFSDRSRALLCRNSPVADSTGRNSTDRGVRRGSTDRGIRRNSTSSEPGSSTSSISVVPLGPGVDPVAVFGSPVASGMVRPARLSQRLLMRSTAIRRSAGARSPAVLIDIDATDSYDDLLALDQFNVRRAVKSSVLKALPCRTPSMEDAQQQRQCHICLQSWLPAEESDTADDTAGVGCSAHGVLLSVAGGVGQQACCQCCGLLQEQQQYMPQLPPLLDAQRQRTLDRMQLCWDGPIGLQGPIVPAPAAASLLTTDDVMHDNTTHAWDGISSGHSPGSSSGGSTGGSSSGSVERPVVQGWSSAVAAADLTLSTAQLSRQVGSSRVDAAAAGSPSGSLGVAAAAVGPYNPAGISRTVSGAGASTSTSGGSSSSSRAVGLQTCCCRRLEGCIAERRKLSAGVQIQQLPCGHEFCSGCIQTWLKEHISCPVCRWTFPEGDTRLINK